VTPGGSGAALDPSLFEPVAPSLGAFQPSGGPMVFRTERVLGSETLSSRSEPQRKMAGPPVAVVSPADAEHLRGHTQAMIGIEGGSVSLGFKVDPALPRGVVLVPRDVEWPVRVGQGMAARVSAAEVEVPT
jgi:hypothetical protein